MKKERQLDKVSDGLKKKERYIYIYIYIYIHIYIYIYPWEAYESNYPPSSYG